MPIKNSLEGNDFCTSGRPRPPDPFGFFRINKATHGHLLLHAICKKTLLICEKKDIGSATINCK